MSERDYSRRCPQISDVPHGQQRLACAREGCAENDVHRHIEAIPARRRGQQRAVCRASGGDELAEQVRAPQEGLYGTRDAAKCWEKDHSTTMATQVYVKGKTSPCLFKHAASGSMASIHGDDFVVGGPGTHLKDLKKAICGKYKAEVRAILRTTSRS